MVTDNIVQNPLVSIIIPCYGVEKYLNRCVETIVNQSLENIEIILVDDGSPDRVPEMCDEWANRDARIKVIHKANAGLGYARNSGLNIARGDYVAFVDSDDYVDIDMYKHLYSAAIKTNADAVYVGYKCIGNNGIVVSKSIEVKETTFFHGKTECQNFCLGMIATPGKTDGVKYNMSVWHSIFKRDLIQRHNIRFVSERQYISEDMIFDIDFFSVAERVVLLPFALYNYCYNGSSLSRKFDKNRFDRNVIQYTEVLNRLDEKQYEFNTVFYADKYLIRTFRSYINALVCSGLNSKEIRMLINNSCDYNEIWRKIKNSKHFCDIPLIPRLYVIFACHKKISFLIMLSHIVNLKNVFKYR